jgi:phenylacetate-CoA ligase
MLNTIRKLMERTVIGESIPALVRWGKPLPRSVIRRIQAEGFREVVQYAARHQKFFARRLREAGIDPREVQGPHDLKGIFTAPEDLLALSPGEFLCREPQAVFETTGTSGGPKRVYFSYDELEFAARYQAAAFYENGMRAGDRVACAFDAAYWIASWVTFLACRKLEVFCSAVGKPHPRELYSRLGTYRYNILVADPTWLVSLSELAAREGPYPVKLIFAAGDRMTEVYRNYVQSVWQAPVILGYGSTEAGGGMGMECRERRGYHLDEFSFLFEVPDPDRDGYGELVITTLIRRTMPLIRYRVRDLTRFLDEPCPCGAPLRRVEKIKGRRDEMVVMGAGNMHPEIFEKVLHDVEGVADNWHVAVRQEGTCDILEFRLGLTDGIQASAVEEAVRRNLQSRFPEVWANQVCGMFRVAFKFFPAETQGPGRKPRRLVDERVEA